MDLALDLMAEFIFHEVDRRGNKRTLPLTTMQEIQLVEVLYDYFNSVNNDTARNSVFLSLFSGTTAIIRSGILSKLVSMAIGIPSHFILISASTLMQQLGNTSPNSYRLANALVKDYFVLMPNSSKQLHLVPRLAPQFASNFLTAVADIYFADVKKGPLIFPPATLLETITDWVSENTQLCVAAQQTQSALPPGAIAMEATTPFAGLLKWCILAPIYRQTSEIYGKLHLGLIENMLEIPHSNPPRAIFAQHLIISIGNICRYAVDLQNRSRKSDPTERQKMFLEDTALHLCLDRFAQAIQIALSVNCVYGNIGDMINQLKQLPFNKLMAIVINSYKNKT
ncbi:uncharacterized protein C7orf26 homolog isoform X2 [Agrilus planipennis]|nr:uncharacterized protein C7orf26 homolog isoform X2 [Agrilus planipennis]